MVHLGIRQVGMMQMQMILLHNNIIIEYQMIRFMKLLKPLEQTSDGMVREYS